MSEPIDVSPSQRKELLDLITRYLPNVEVWAFGSRVKWTARSNSDLDLVAFAKPEDEARVSRLKEALEESSLPFRVDFLVWDNIPENFKKNIQERYVVLVEAVGLGRGRVMSSNLPEIPLAEIVTIQGGKRLPAGKNLQSVPSKHPYIRVRDVGQRSLPRDGIEYIPDDVFPSISRYIVQENDVVLSIVGTIGALSIVDSFYDYASLTENCVKLTGLDYCDALYLYYYLSSSIGQQEISQGTVGAVQPKLPIYNIEKIKVLWPEDKDRRKGIATVLGNLDDKIDINRRINQTLEAMAQALFKSWFVDFEPVKAKITAIQEGRDPMRAAMSAISGKPDAELDTLPPEALKQLAATAALFPDDMEESELGEIPRGWIVSDMRTLAEVISKGTTPNKSDIANAKDLPIVPFIKVKDISEDGEIVRGNLELIARSIHESSLKRSILKTDDLLFSIAGTIGRTAFVDDDLNGANVNQAIAFIRLNDKLDHFALCWLTLRSMETKNFIASKVVQAVQANASLANVGDIPVRLPSNDVLKKWNGIVSPLILEYRARLGEIRTLATLRDTLLPKLLSGELSVEALSEPTGAA
jgi:type I restriction enzyme S subunit